MNEQYPMVTVITPSFNRGDYLGETIDSVVNQQYPNLEYIVLDDGSTDHTRDVLAAYNGRIRSESHKNMGETRSVNKGILMGHGDIFCIVNSDDPLLPGAIHTAIAFMQEHPDVLVAYPNWVKIGPTSERFEDVVLPEYDYFYMVRQHHCIVGPGAFIRRRAFELAGEMRDPEFRYVADFEFWLRAGLYGPFARIPHFLATFRVHPNSASKALTGRRMANEHIRLMNKYYSRPDIPIEIQNIKREAYGWAHFIAAEFSGPNRWLARFHYLAFIFYNPHGFQNLQWAKNKLITDFFKQ